MRHLLYSAWPRIFHKAGRVFVNSPCLSSANTPNSQKRWDPLALLQGSFGPFGPKVANRVRKWVPGPSRPRGPKSAKRSRKRVKIDYFSTTLTLFRLCFGLFGPRGRKGPGTHFRTLFATLSPKGPNDPCSGQKFSQQKRPFLANRLANLPFLLFWRFRF